MPSQNLPNCLHVCFVVAMVLSIGCTPNDDTGVVSNSDQPTISAAEILQTVIDQYTEASTYQDQAVLYLSYRLNGRAIREPHPWSVAWDRNGKLSADLFNAKIRNDGQYLSCYVFDIESGNIDNQHLLVPKAGIGHILSDPIASHFVFGTSELPLDPIETESENRLIQPILGFMEPKLMPDWLKTPNDAKRLPDDSSLGDDCYVIELVSDQRNYRIWVNKVNGNIEQIRLPLHYLDSQILAAEQVQGLQFLVRFHDAILNAPLPPERLQIPKRLAAKTVRHFVELPEAIPCERLGEKISKVNLQQPNGEEFSLQQSEISALVWLADFNATETLQRFEKLVNQCQPLEIDAVAVYSEDLLESPNSSSKMIRSEVQSSILSPTFRYAFDAQMKFGSQLKLKSVPSVLIVDKNQTIQYAQTLSEEKWVQDAKVAIERIAAGEKLSKEMIADYEKFMDDYLKEVAAQESQQANPRTGRSNPARSSTLQSSLAWQNDQMTSPGNIHVPKNSTRIFVLDGGQSVVELNSSGGIVDRNRLQLPSDVAINRIRTLQLADRKLMFCAFSMLGDKAFVFDEQWQPMFDFDSSKEFANTGGITECQLVATDNGGELWISFIGQPGLVKINQNGDWEPVSKQACRAFHKSSTHLYMVSKKDFYVDGVKIDLDGQWNFKSLRSDPTSPDRCIVVTNDERGEWAIRSLRFDGQINWNQSVPAQLLSTTVEPIVTHGSISELFIGVAIDRQLRVFTPDANKWIEFDQKAFVTGISFLSDKKEFALISDGQIVKAQTLENGKSKVIPVSTATGR